MLLSVLGLVVGLAPPPAHAQRDAWLRRSSEPIELPGGSRVDFHSIESDSIRASAAFSVFTPPSYARGDTRYPVVYFLHGLFNDHTSWTIDRHGDIPRLIDENMASGALREMVLVFPDGGQSFYTNYRDGSADYEDLIVSELPAHIESHYRVKPGARSRAIAGTSMGGYGALKIAMRFPDRFAAVAAHSPIVFPMRSPLDVPAGARSGRYYRYLSGIFLTVYGDPFDQAYFDANNPLELAKAAELEDLAIYFDYGTADRYNQSVGLGQGLRKLDAVLTRRGVAHRFGEYDGEPHGWKLVYTHIGESLAFIADHLE
jgi:S-formylglutathione hydrolase FrmB